MKFIIPLLFPILSFGQTNFEKKVFLEKIEILVPKELSSMPSEKWEIKYHNLPKPEVALSDENIEVNFLIDLTNQPAKESQLESYKDFRLSKLKDRDDFKLLAEGLESINGKKVGYIKFQSEATDQKVFNYYAFTIVDNKILFFTFNCIEKLRSDWEPAIEKMLSSLTVK